MPSHSLDFNEKPYCTPNLSQIHRLREEGKNKKTKAAKYGDVLNELDVLTVIKILDISQ